MVESSKVMIASERSGSEFLFDRSEEFVPVTSSLSSLESLLSVPELPEPQQKFLRFRLGQETTSLVPVEAAIAVVTVSASEILPIPHMPAFVRGVLNWRGDAIWVVDLARQLAVEPMVELSSHRSPTTVMVVGNGTVPRGQVLGLAIAAVQDIETHRPDQLYAPSSELFAAELLPFLMGYFSDDRSIVLDVSAVLSDERFSVHASDRSLNRF